MRTKNLMPPIQLKPEDYLPKAPQGRKDHKIGIIGCGGIVNHAHLPAYQQMGFNIAACCDVNEKAMQQTREKWGIESGVTDYRKILDDPSIEIVDIAIHQVERIDIVQEAAEAGKHILLQKPFAHTMFAAKTMVDAAEKAGVKLMINQQGRYAPVNQAIARLLEQDIIGDLYQIEYRLRGNQDDRYWWYVNVPWVSVADHGVHYIDLCRWWAGERTPERVAAMFTYMNGQHSQYPMYYDLLMEFDPYLSASHSFNNVTRTKAWRTRIRLEGNRGAIESDGNRVWIYDSETEDPIFEHAVSGSWFPDAFGGTMSELIEAINQDREPWISGRRNLQTLAVAIAAVDSHRSGAFVKPQVW